MELGILLPPTFLIADLNCDSTEVLSPNNSLNKSENIPPLPPVVPTKLTTDKAEPAPLVKPSSRYAYLYVNGIVNL